MLKPAFSESNEEVARLTLDSLAGQPTTTASNATYAGSISFKGLGGEDAACKHLLLNIAAAHVSLQSIDRISTSWLFPEGLISYTVSGTKPELANFRRLVGSTDY